jgi:predicted polyphosphate/ATP-dependent NAD kinase
MFRLGLIVNPLAGVGGSVGLKGSDGEATALKALALGAEPKANLRTQQALEPLAGLEIELITYPGEMGEDSARIAGFKPRVIGTITAGHTCAEDTERAAREMAKQGVDLILFAGGDGTARNICHAIGDATPVLGIPAGVKIHSGVYAVTPKAPG